MSEKRFSYGETDLFEWVEDNGEMISTKECVNKLNEQQATIEQLQRICGTINSLYNKINHLKEENEQLRQQLQEKQEEEKLYANEILELNKTKKEMLNFRNLGSDY